jgi:hypothetical protein
MHVPGLTTNRLLVVIVAVELASTSLLGAVGAVLTSAVLAARLQVVHHRTVRAAPTATRAVVDRTALVLGGVSRDRAR